MAETLRINGIDIKKPEDFDMEQYTLTKSARLAGGLMSMEFIAKKRKFVFKYTVLSGKDLKTIVDILFSDNNDLFFTLTYTDNDEIKTATVYVGAIKRKRFRTDFDGWYWKDVSFDLIEQ